MLTVNAIEIVSFVVGGSVVVVEVDVTISVTVSDVVAVLSEGTVAVSVIEIELISCSLF